MDRLIYSQTAWRFALIQPNRTTLAHLRSRHLQAHLQASLASAHSWHPTKTIGRTARIWRANSTSPATAPTSVRFLTRPFFSVCHSLFSAIAISFSRSLTRSRSWLASGWLWGAPVAGRISDLYGRRTALYLFFIPNAIGAITSAIAPGAWWYLLSRHITGVGLGGSSLTGYLIGTEYSPRSRATMVKVGWSLFSVVGYIWQSFFAKFLFYSLPGYNWRLFHLVMFAPYPFAHSPTASPLLVLMMHNIIDRFCMF